MQQNDKLDISATVDETLASLRLDQALARLFPDFSRSRLQQWIRSGYVCINGRPTTRIRDKVEPGQQISISATIAPENDSAPEDIPLNVIYEDDWLLVINKPAGLVVHPAAGNRSGTLLNALLHYLPSLERIPRAGIIHRLDKDTSGLLIVTKDLTTHKQLVAALQERNVHREYRAIVQGVMTAGGTVDAPIGRHRTNRTRMAVDVRGKSAVSHYRVVERYRAHTLVNVRLESGRTHQIRVHMAHIHHPLVGDPAYGGRLRIPANCTEALAAGLRAFRRQALHAFQLGLRHPHTDEQCAWTAPLPDDMQQLITLLREDARESHQ